MKISKESYETFLNRFVYYYLKIFGLCPFKFPEDNFLIRCKITTIYTCTLCSVNIILFSFLLKSRISVILSCETWITIISDSLSVVLELLTITSIWMNAAFSQDLLYSMIKAFTDLSNSLQPLGIQINNSNIVRTSNHLVLLVNCVYFLLNTINMLVFINVAILEYETLLVWYVCSNLRVLPHTCTVYFVCAIVNLERYLRLVNEFVRQFPMNIRGSREINTQGERIRRYEDEKSCLRVIAQTHKKLRVLLKMIEKYFRAPMVFFLITHFMDITSYFYLICLHLMKETTEIIEITFLAFVIWFVVHTIEVLVVIEAVNAVVLQGNQAGSILHRMISEYHPKPVVDAVKVISLQILQEPLQFTLYGLIDMKPSQLYTIFSAITTYFVMMIQLDVQTKSNISQC